MSIPSSAAQRPMPPGLAHRPKVGVVRAFTGHYNSVHLLHRFLEYAGFAVKVSRQSTAPIIETGTSLASADFCFPLRVYVGHIETLCLRHPDLEAILAPNVWFDRFGSATCCKYRDAGGVAIRSLGGMIPYLEGRRGGREQPLPHLIRPNIQADTYDAMQKLAFEVYVEILGLGTLSRFGFFVPAKLQRRWAPHVAHVQAAFARAWQEVMERPGDRKRLNLQDESRPRLALVGRNYLIDDPGLTADMKPWFQRRGAAIWTARDVPPAELEPLYRAAEGFYDTHKEGQAFIDWAADKVDGFITMGSFGCHPDAFQVDYLAEYIRSKGKPAWTFRFDETAGTAGFQTRFETIFGFLEQQRDKRLRSHPAAIATMPSTTANSPAAIAPAAVPPEGNSPAAIAPPTVAPEVNSPPAIAPPANRPDAAGDDSPTPLFVWPYMGEEMNLMIQEILTQLGLQELAHPPGAIDGSTLELGGRRYAETCSPYACATGSLMQTVRDAVQELRTDADRHGRPLQPRRILALMVQGEGPCTFGWYAIAQNRHLAGDLAADLTDGHSLELFTVGMKEPMVLLRQLVELGDARRMDPVVRYLEAKVTGGWSGLPPWERLRLLLRFTMAYRSLLAPVWAKLAAAEAVRARSLLVRAHEREPGATLIAYRECLEVLSGAHTLWAIRRARSRCLHRLAAIPQDQERKPRVAAVGEIYVSLTSFANRGVVEKLLGRQGIEVIEGITLSGFIRRSLWEMRRRSLADHPRVKPLRLWLQKRGIRWLAPRPMDLRARPFLEWEVGGEGMPGVGEARTLVEQGCDGIIHVYPFKCMPEGIAKDAYKELSDLYGVRYLGLSFDKEQDMERVKTEVATFTTLLRAQAAQKQGWMARWRLRWQRWALGRHLTRSYRAVNRKSTGAVTPER